MGGIAKAVAGTLWGAAARGVAGHRMSCPSSALAAAIVFTENFSERRGRRERKRKEVGVRENREGGGGLIGHPLKGRCSFI
jgi:hypothetical protein